MPHHGSNVSVIRQREPHTSNIQQISISLCILAAHRLFILQLACRKPQAILVAAGLAQSHIQPKAPRAVDAVRASNEALTLEIQVFVLIGGPALYLGISWEGLISCNVTYDALACFTYTNVSVS